MIATLRRWRRQFAEGFRHGFYAPERRYAERFGRAYLGQVCRGRQPLSAFVIATREADRGSK